MSEMVTTANEIKNVVDVIGRIVESVQAEYDTVNSEKPYYDHGHPLEIINTLKEKGSNDELKFKKFPAIFLIEDIPSTVLPGIFALKSKLNLIIVTDTSKDYKADERYVQSFDAILTPIYDLFMKHLKLSGEIRSVEENIPHDVFKHLYWGKKGLYGSDGNIFDDHIDAIEIKDLEINIFR
jgi:hypothetical protein